MRITQKDLEATLSLLNQNSKRVYRLGFSYGKVNLEVLEKGTSINTVSVGNTKSELYYQLQTVLNYISREKKTV